MKSDDKILKEHANRLERLEKAVFGSEPKTTKIKPANFKGAKGGCLFLISKGFFDKKRVATEVKEELENNRYFYNIQVVQTTLNRLSDKHGPLVSFTEKNKKVYVRRR